MQKPNLKDKAMSKEDKVVSNEIRKVVWIKATDEIPDTHVLSICVIHESGREDRYMTAIRDYKRPFWVTLPGYRDHEQKRVTAKKEECQEYLCTQSELPTVVKRALPYGSGYNMYTLRDSPYLYGVDQESEFLLRHNHNIQHKSEKTYQLRYGSYDIETGIIQGPLKNKILCASAAVEDTVYISILEEFVAGIPDYKQKLIECVQTQLSEDVAAGLEVIWDFTDEKGVIRNPIKFLHQQKPDIVGVWGLGYDIPTIVKRMDELGVDPKEVMSDPSVPEVLRKFEYIPGPVQTISKSGKYTSLAPHKRWNTVRSTAYFEWMDDMCTFSEIRSQESEIPSMKLDAILTEFLGRGKLDFSYINDSIKVELSEEAKAWYAKAVKLRKKIGGHPDDSTLVVDTLGGVGWHVNMQTNHPIEYCTYNIFDTYSKILLNRKIKDMSLTLPVFMKNSSPTLLPKRVKRLTHRLYLYSMDRGLVPGTAYTNYPDEDILGLDDWIVTADAYKILDGGCKCLKYNPNKRTGIYTNLSEVDLKSAYPMTFMATGASKSTNVTELCDIGGRKDGILKAELVSNMHGGVNAVSFMREVCELPSLETLEAEILREL
jgi:DNA polymerase elongation subunit (family B)